jgi:glycosyltransferase involved in cell wall biosynthesis
LRPVHQVLAAASPDDAVTNQAFAWQCLLAEWGHPTEVVAEHVHPDLTGRVHRLDRTGKRLIGDANLVLRYAIGSDTAELALKQPDRVALCYHNITPGELLREFNPAVADLCDRGRQALERFSRPAVLIADSSFNAMDLRAAGLGEAAVVPLLLDVPSTPPLRLDAQEQPTVVSVGRIVPNKRLDDVIKVFALYQRHHAPGARLVLVGSSGGFESYRRALEQLVDDVGAEQVVFTGAISNRARDAWYDQADVYLSMSVHEGFCAPLVEAMGHGVPVVARRAGAVPETLGDAGLALEGDDLPLFAEAVHEVVSSPRTRAALNQAATRRLDELSPEAVAMRIRAALAPILDAS